MTTSNAELDRMRQAFAGDTAAGVDCPPATRIWEAAHGRLEPSDAAARVDAALERAGLTDLADRPAHRLSGGQKQLLAIASVLVAEPAVVVADEPTTLLDARNARRIAEHFDTLDQQLIVVSHQLDLLESFDRVVVMEAGRVVADDVPRAALDAYRVLIG